MSTISTTIKRVCTLPNPVVSGHTLNSVAAAVNYGSTLFVLKTKGVSSDNKYYPISIIKIAKFNASGTPTAKSLTVKKNSKVYGAKCIHANSITCAKPEGASKGYLYVATGNSKDKPQVLKIDFKGNVEQELYRYNIKGEKASLGTLTYYGQIDGKMYFISPNGSSNNRIRFALVEYDGKKFQNIRTLFYGAETVNTSWTRNDITYRGGKFYQTFFKSVKGVIKQNRIYVYHLGDISTLVGQNLEPNEILEVSGPKEYDKCFEVEGVVEYKDILYGAIKSRDSKSNPNRDTIFKITRK